MSRLNTVLCEIERFEDFAAGGGGNSIFICNEIYIVGCTFHANLISNDRFIANE